MDQRRQAGTTHAPIKRLSGAANRGGRLQQLRSADRASSTRVSFLGESGLSAPFPYGQLSVADLVMI